ncbi:MAG: branched-chain amino acid ABC transporter permease, partial [Bauldia sp.]
MSALPRREILLFSGLAVLVALVFSSMGAAYGTRMMVEASCYAIIGLGLTIQWGYAGLFNVGVMGFIALAAFVSLFVTYPVNQAFWSTGAPGELGWAFAAMAVGAVLVWAASQTHRLGLPTKWRTLLTMIVLAIVYLWVQSILDPATAQIERSAGWIDGLGLPVWLGWVAGGA